MADIYWASTKVQGPMLSAIYINIIFESLQTPWLSILHIKGLGLREIK